MPLERALFSCSIFHIAALAIAAASALCQFWHNVSYPETTAACKISWLVPLSSSHMMIIPTLVVGILQQRCSAKHAPDTPVRTWNVIVCAQNKCVSMSSKICLFILHLKPLVQCYQLMQKPWSHQFTGPLPCSPTSDHLFQRSC